MTKPVQLLNKYHMKEMLLHGNPQFENFYKEDLIQFCNIAKDLLQDEQEKIDKANNKINIMFNEGNEDRLIDDLSELKNILEEGNK